MSLVELMVGIAVGLFVVAAAALMASSQLSDNRALLLETQLQQDLRATADYLARDLRRSGANRDKITGLVPSPDDTQPRTVTNDVTRPGPIIDGNELTYGYMLSEPVYTATLRIRLANNVIETCRSQPPDWACTNPGDASGWQPMTDINTVKITAFSISTDQDGTRARAANKLPIKLPCQNLCTLDPTDPDATSCWPSVSMQELVIWVTGQSVADERIKRSMKATVRVRNPYWKINDAYAEIPSGEACPRAPLP